MFGNLRRKFLSTPEQTLYTCSQCGAGFDDQQKLSRHETEKHAGVTDYRNRLSQLRCDDCGATFASENNLEEHVKATHRVVGSPSN